MSSPARVEEHLPRAIALRMGAVVCFACMAAAIKLASEQGANLVEILFYRSFFSLPLLLLWIGAGPGLGAIRPNRPMAHAYRAAIGLASTALTFQALVVLPLPEATVLSFTAPLFSTAFSAVLLAESVGRFRWTSVLVGFLGVIVVIQPGGSSLTLQGCALGLLAAMVVAYVAILLRQISMTESATATVFWFAISNILLSGVAQLWFGQAHALQIWLFFLVIGVAGGGAQLLYTASFRYGPVSALSPFDYTQLLWVSILSWALWQIPPRLTTWLGGAIIAGSAIYLLYRQRRVARQRP